MIDTEQAEERDRSQIVDRADDMEEALEMSINRRRRENRRALLAEGVLSVYREIEYIYYLPSGHASKDHTALTAPHPVCSAKLSSAWPG
jgi:hypothetical protein